MANELKSEKKTTAVAMLCEGSSIRAIERMTGIHRDTVIVELPARPLNHPLRSCNHVSVPNAAVGRAGDRLQRVNSSPVIIPSRLGNRHEFHGVASRFFQSVVQAIGSQLRLEAAQVTGPAFPVDTGILAKLAK